MSGMLLQELLLKSMNGSLQAVLRCVVGNPAAQLETIALLSVEKSARQKMDIRMQPKPVPCRGCRKH